MNCGFEFKKQKSKVLSEAENNFTIFATVGAEAEAVASKTSTGMEEDFHQESSSMATDGTELYDPPADMADLNEPDLENSNDFELDLSGADGSDSESWDIGATLTEDLSENASATPEDSLSNADLGSSEFEVQGLGFDLTGGLEPAETEVANEEDSFSPELELNAIADETMVPEMEPYARQNEIEFELKEDDSAHQDKVEDTSHEPSSQGKSLELNDSSAQDPEQSSDAGLGEISLETESELEDKESEAGQTSEIPVDFKNPEIELNPTIELENLQLDQETASTKLEPIQANPSSVPEGPLEDPKLKMDSSEGETNPILPDEESTPDR